MRLSLEPRATGATKRMSDIPEDQAPWSRKPAGEEMKGNAFGDRARQLTEWFQAWNSCEQTIALYSLLSKVSAIQARFLSLVLEHSLKNGYDSKELTRLEELANDAGEWAPRSSGNPCFVHLSSAMCRVLCRSDLVQIGVRLCESLDVALHAR